MKQTELGTYVLTDRWADYAWLAEMLSWTIPYLVNQSYVQTALTPVGPVFKQITENNLPRVGVDVETKTLKKDAKQPDPQRDALVGVGLAMTDYRLARGNIMVPIYSLATDGLINVLKDHLERLPWYAHNAMFDATVLRRYGIRLGEHAGDPRIVAYMLGEPEAALKTLLAKWLGYPTLEYHEILEQWGANDISEVPVEAQADYCALQDAAQCVILEQTMRASLTERVMAVYEKVELPMVNILVGMTHRGIRFDREAAIPILEVETRGRDTMDELIGREVEATGFKQWESKDGQPYLRRCEECKGGKKAKLTCERCWGFGKEFPRPVPFNPASTDQVREWLYVHMAAPVKRRSKDSGEASTDSLALLQLKGFHPAIPLILSRKKFAKRAQFLTKWLELSEPDGRLHTMFSNTRVATGRLSSYGPNLQQVTLDLRVLFIAD